MGSTTHFVLAPRSSCFYSPLVPDIWLLAVSSWNWIIHFLLSWKKTAFLFGVFIGLAFDCHCFSPTTFRSSAFLFSISENSILWWDLWSSLSDLLFRTANSIFCLKWLLINRSSLALAVAKIHLVASLLHRVMNWQKDSKGRVQGQARLVPAEPQPVDRCQAPCAGWASLCLTLPRAPWPLQT